jgi:hypothetical protein
MIFSSFLVWKKSFAGFLGGSKKLVAWKTGGIRLARELLRCTEVIEVTGRAADEG